MFRSSGRLPLGVLQRRHHSMFDPPLPKKHREVLDTDGIKMGNLTHVVVQFPRVWWDDSLAKWCGMHTVTHMAMTADLPVTSAGALLASSLI
jgi:hypothetical protein